MILKRLLAIDVLKYGRLELKELPERGVVLLTGRNESGKSTIGETICLALFGRTFALPEHRIGKCVRWDQPEAVLELEFDVAGKAYRVNRKIDRNGSMGATLHKPGGVEVTGWQQVAGEVERIVGFGFREFTESFYLARREIATPHPRSETVRAMAGVLPLEEASGDLRERLENERSRVGAALESIEELQSRIDALRQQRALPDRRSECASRAQAVDAAAGALGEGLPGVERVVDLLENADDTTTEKRWKAIALGLREGAREVHRFAELVPFPNSLEGDGLDSAGRRIGTALSAFEELKAAVEPRRRRLAALLGEGVTLAGVTALDDEEDELSRKASRIGRSRNAWAVAAASSGLLALAAAVLAIVPLEQVPPEWPPFLYGGVALFVVLFVAFALRVQGAVGRLAEVAAEQESLDSKRSKASKEAHYLDKALTYAPARAAEALSSGTHGDVANAAKDFTSGPGRRLVDAGARRALLAQVRPAYDEAKAAIEETLDEAKVERGVLAELDSLFEERDELRDEVAHSEDRCATWELSVELLDAAAKELTFRFNRDVRRSMSRILPGLTEGRYQYLQIDDDFQVKVFSSDKQDFVLYEEISGGTQRQISLATRMALSEGLVETAQIGRQFMFLDEPFAFFDAERTRISMGKLPGLSDNLCQLFIAAQEPPEGGSWALHVQTSRETEKLVVSGQRV